MKKLIIWTSIVAFALIGCATKTQTGGLVGTGVGAAVGAGLGQAIGHDTTSTLVGAAIGAAAGGLAGGAIGNYMDKQEAAMRQALADSEAASIRREQEVLSQAQTDSTRRDQEVLSQAQTDSTRKVRDVLTVTFKSDMFFAVNSSTLFPGAYDEIDRVANVLNQYPDTRIQVGGHTDSTGGAEHNQKLSQQRADGVKNALVGKGVSASRISAIGYGENKPVASNNTEAGRQQNRRVEIRIVPMQG